MGYWNDRVKELANPDRPESLQDVEFVPEKDDWPKWATEDDYELTGRNCPVCHTGRIFKRMSKNGEKELRCENSEYNCSFSNPLDDDE